MIRGVRRNTEWHLQGVMDTYLLNLIPIDTVGRYPELNINFDRARDYCVSSGVYSIIIGEFGIDVTKFNGPRGSGWKGVDPFHFLANRTSRENRGSCR